MFKDHTAVSKPATTNSWVIVTSWGRGELLTCPYTLKIQACPPQDRRPDTQSKVSGQGDFSVSNKGSLYMSSEM